MESLKGQATDTKETKKSTAFEGIIITSDKEFFWKARLRTRRTATVWSYGVFRQSIQIYLAGNRLDEQGKGKTADDVHSLLNIIFKAAVKHSRFNKLFPKHKLYDLRTTFYTRCQECGVADVARDKFVGHSLGALGNAYTDLSNEFLIREANKLNYWFYAQLYAQLCIIKVYFSPEIKQNWTTWQTAECTQK